MRPCGKEPPFNCSKVSLAAVVHKTASTGRALRLLYRHPQASTTSPSPCPPSSPPGYVGRPACAGRQFFRAIPQAPSSVRAGCRYGAARADGVPRRTGVGTASPADAAPALPAIGLPQSVWTSLDWRAWGQAAGYTLCIHPQSRCAARWVVRYPGGGARWMRKGTIMTKPNQRPRVAWCRWAPPGAHTCSVGVGLTRVGAPTRASYACGRLSVGHGPSTAPKMRVMTNLHAPTRAAPHANAIFGTPAGDYIECAPRQRASPLNGVIEG